jgi:uncharacterized protein YdhG (YjbR/CyaY superfamily)
MIKYNSFEHYIEEFPSEISSLLIQIQTTISEIAPDAVPCIAYNMPAFNYLGKPLVYFAAFKNHIGFYALPSGNEAFKAELSKYKTGKGSIQFPLSEPMPFDLIRDIVRFRVAEVMSAAQHTGKKKKS